MDERSALDLVQTRTAELVAQRLRSDSVVISRLRVHIEDAARLGHSHKAIHASIEAGGLGTSWNNYRVYLARARKALRKEAFKPASPPWAPHLGDDAPAPPPGDAGNPSPSRVLDALASARQTASKDYARIARDLYRKDRP
jgi:hypothetical protein